MTDKETEANQAQGRPPAGAGPTPQAVAVATDAVLERFTRSFEASARRWEFIVYPSLFGFTLLAAYGFFLIYSLTRDMSVLAHNVDPRMATNMESMAMNITTLATNVAAMSQNVDELTQSIQTMNTNIEAMRGHTESMSASTGEMSRKLNALDPIQANMTVMSQTMRVMTTNTGVMSRDMSNMNYNIGRPMNFMNSFFPW